MFFVSAYPREENDHVSNLQRNVGYYVWGRGWTGWNVGDTLNIVHEGGEWWRG